MKTVVYSTKAKKDLKRYRHNAEKMQQLFSVLQMLSRGEPLSAPFKPHPLTGNYKDCMECHVGNDFLLIWQNPDADTVYVLRIGSHAELFGK